MISVSYCLDVLFFRVGERVGFGGNMFIPRSEGPMVDLLLERKRIEDLVGSSAKGDHLRQLRRMDAWMKP